MLRCKPITLVATHTAAANVLQSVNMSICVDKIITTNGLKSVNMSVFCGIDHYSKRLTLSKLRLSLWHSSLQLAAKGVWLANLGSPCGTVHYCYC